MPAPGPVTDQGSQINILPEDIDSNKITITWRQNWGDRSEDYYVCKYRTYVTGTRSLIFIQASKLEEFKNKKATSERDFDFNINEEFQYGESRDKSTRFLVYHDKGNQIFQHRFMETFATKLGGGAAKIFDMIYLPGTDALNLAKNYVGDYLKNMPRP